MSAPLLLAAALLAASPADTLVVGTLAEPSTLEPHMATDIVSAEIVSNVCEPLVRVRPGSRSDTPKPQGSSAAMSGSASISAWAIAGLVAAGRTHGREARRGVHWLVSRQAEDGGWDEKEFTGTGFPKVFYLRYHYYRLYFPLMAMARWCRAARGSIRRAGIAREMVA